MASRISGRLGRGEGSLEMRGGSIPQRSATTHGFRPRLAAENERLVPPLGAEGVMGESLDVLPQSVALEALDLLDDPRVDGAPAIDEEAAVRHLLGQRVLERVLRIGKRRVS